MKLIRAVLAAVILSGIGLSGQKSSSGWQDAAADTVKTENQDTADAAEEPAPEPKAQSESPNSSLSGLRARLHVSITTEPFNDEQPVKRMTIDEAIDGLLRYNPEIIRARLDWLASRDKFFSAFGNFEPALVGHYKYEATDRATALLEQAQNTYSTGIEGLLPTATKYNLSMSVTDVQNRFSDNLNKPSAFAGLTLSQPLLQGLWFGAPILEIKAAQTNRKIALHKFRSVLFEKIQELETTYWKLCFAQEKVGFAARSVDIAGEIAEDGKLQVKAGKISPLEALEATAGLASRLSNLFDARKDLIAAANELKVLIAGRMFLSDSIIRAETSMRIVQQDSAGDVGPDPSFEKIALVQPDFLQKKYELEKERLSRDYQANQCLPEVTLKGSYGYLVTGSSSDVMWNNFSNPLYRLRCPTYGAEVELRIPLGSNIKERKLLSAQKRNVMAAEEFLLATQIQIENYLSATQKRIRDIRKNLGNATIVVEYRTTLLAAEIRRQKAGKSTFRKIFEIEEELTKSLELEMENILDYRSSKAGKARLTGTTLIAKKLETIVNDKPVLDRRLAKEP